MDLINFDKNGVAAAREVLWLFLIPVGGGIPSGVLLARNNGVGWPLAAGLYFASDLILACLFEPMLLLVVSASKRSSLLAQVIERLKQGSSRYSRRFGKKFGPLALVLLSFGIDPMTGRSTAKAMGHGFLAGWAIAIAGDMLYFAVIAWSTLALNQVVDETSATVLILVAMFIGPAAVQKIAQVWRSRRALRAAKFAAFQSEDTSSR